MTTRKQNNNEQWELLVLLIKKVAIEKFGNGWTIQLAAITPFTRNNISRFLGLNYSPSIRNLMILAEALEINFSIDYPNDNIKIVKHISDYKLILNEKGNYQIALKKNSNGH